MSKPFSQACENNKQPIFDIISHYFHAGDRVLEIGSHTGQHIVHFAEKLPQIHWIPSEIPGNISVITAGLADNDAENILPVLTLDVEQETWPISACNGIFSANTLHIMSEARVRDFFRGAGKVLDKGARLCVYGPFKYGGKFTSDSNAGFEQWLKDRDEESGIRDFEFVNQLAGEAGLTLINDHAMPANNQLLVWEKAGLFANYFPV